jgi:tRNA pseudouridine(38-40) synthase
MGRGVTRFDARRDATQRLYEYQCPTPALVNRPEGVALSLEQLKAVRITRQELEQVRAVLCVFEGPHDFHNFTADKCSDEAPTDTVRLVTKFTCLHTRVSPSSGIEYVALEVLGDSFIYHQIRKMVGLAIFALRYKPRAQQVSFVKSVLHDKAERYVPLAPSVGLMLERVLFCKENKTHGGHTVLVDFSNVANEIKAFKTQRIYPEIDAREAAHRNTPTPNVQVPTPLPSASSPCRVSLPLAAHAHRVVCLVVAGSVA